MVEQKILEVFKGSGMSRTEFAEKLQIANATLSHLASGRNKASLDLVIAVLNNFPDISADWLILNKGEMYRQARDLNLLKAKVSQHIHQLNGLNKEISNELELIKKELETLK